VELGIEITGSNEEPFGAGEVSFTGFKVASSLFFNATPPRLDFILLNLTLPGQEAADRSLLDLIEKTSVEQWLSSGASVLAGLLAETVTDAEVKKQVAAITTSVLNLLGLTGTLPPVAWERLLREPDQAAAIFLQWFQAIASSATQLAGFLNNVYALRNAIVPVAGDAADHVTGIGTRSDPFAIELIKVAGVIAVNFTVATEFDDQKRLHVYPGLRAASTPFQPVNQVAVQLAAATEVIDIVLDAAPQGVLHTVAPPTPFPSLSLLAVLANPKPGQPLFTIGSQDGEPRLSLGTAALGVAYGTVDPKDDARTLIPTLRLNNVTGTYGSWEAIDLTNYDQTLRLLGEGLAAFVAEKLKQFLGESGGALAANLAAVLGIAPPPNYPGTWPVQEMLLSGGQLQLLIENPLGALGSYYTRCLQAVDTEGQPAWRHLLPSFAGMLGGAGVSIAGAGTAGDPWQVELAQLGGQGPVASLQAWRPALDEPSQLCRLCERRPALRPGHTHDGGQDRFTDNQASTGPRHRIFGRRMAGGDPGPVASIRSGRSAHDPTVGRHAPASRLCAAGVRMESGRGVSLAGEGRRRGDQVRFRSAAQAHRERPSGIQFAFHHLGRADAGPIRAGDPHSIRHGAARHWRTAGPDPDLRSRPSAGAARSHPRQAGARISLRDPARTASSPVLAGLDDRRSGPVFHQSLARSTQPDRGPVRVRETIRHTHAAGARLGAHRLRPARQPGDGHVGRSMGGVASNRLESGSTGLGGKR